jgi:tellurite resistance protein TerC
VGSKIFVQQFIGKIDPAISLGITISILLGGIALSLWKTRNDPPKAKAVLAE